MMQRLTPLVRFAAAAALALCAVACTATTSSTTSEPTSSTADSTTSERTAAGTAEPDTLDPAGFEPTEGDDTAPSPAPPAATALESEAAVPTPTPVGEATPTDPCTSPDFRFDVINVAPDDPDGGLVVHTAPGAETPEVGVLAWNTRELSRQPGGCQRAADGGTWIEVADPVVRGWVNAFYIGRSETSDTDLGAQPCSASSSERPTGADRQGGGSIHITRVTAVSDAACDRVVFEFVVTATDGTTTTLAEFSAADIRAFELRPSAAEVQISSAGPGWEFPLWPEIWRDVATGELNAATTFRRGDVGAARVDWGTGTGVVRFLDGPARIVVDVFQEPTPAGVIVGPVVSGSTVLFDPVQTASDGVADDGPLRLAGWTWGFEASSLLGISSWDGSASLEPGDAASSGPVEFIPGSGRPPTVATIEPAPQFGGVESGVWYFTATGLFEFQIDDLPDGSWQLWVSPDTGCGRPVGVGQRFHIGTPAADAPSETFGIRWEQGADPGADLLVVVRPGGDEPLTTLPDPC